MSATATTTNKPRTMRKYRVLAGIHIDNHPTQKDELGKPVDRITRAGEDVETTQDLDKLNTPGFQPKFQRIHGDEPIPYQKPRVVDLSSMNEIDLAQFATDNDIEIKGLKTKDEKLKAIRAALAE